MDLLHLKYSLGDHVINIMRSFFFFSLSLFLYPLCTLPSAEPFYFYFYFEDNPETWTAALRPLVAAVAVGANVAVLKAEAALFGQVLGPLDHLLQLLSLVLAPLLPLPHDLLQPFALALRVQLLQLLAALLGGLLGPLVPRQHDVTPMAFLSSC